MADSSCPDNSTADANDLCDFDAGFTAYNLWTHEVVASCPPNSSASS